MSGQERLVQGPSEPSAYKNVSSLVVFYCNIVVGINFSLVGLALQSFSEQLNASALQVCMFLAIIFASSFAGELSARFVFKVIKRQLASIVALAAVTVSVIYLPHAHSLWGFYIAGGVYGYGIGIFERAQTAWIINHWHNQAGRSILQQHFSYSLGTLLGPLILEFFLVDPNPSTEHNDSPDVIASSLAWPFGIAGWLMGAGVLAQIILCYCWKNSEDSTSNADTPVEHSVGSKLQVNRLINILRAFAVFTALYMPMEKVTMQFLSPFAQFSPVALTEKQAGWVLCAWAAGFTIARGLGIFVVFRSHQYVLIVNIILMWVGNSILYFLGGSQVLWLYVGSICFGLGFSTSYPAFYAYVEKYFFVSESEASDLAFLGKLTSAVYVLLIGSYMKNDPAMLNYFCYFSLVVITCIFGFLLVYTSRIYTMFYTFPGFGM